MDGAWGPHTLAALNKWQAANGFPQTDAFDAQQWQAFFELVAPDTHVDTVVPKKLGTPVFPEPGVVTTDLLNIRCGVGINNPLIASPLPKGKSLTVLEENNGWYRVKTQIEGWVNKDFVQIQN